MTVDYALSDGQSVRRAILLLNDLGHRAEAGSAQVGNPFTVRVRGVDPGDVSALRALMASVDPGSHRVRVSTVNAAPVTARAA